MRDRSILSVAALTLLAGGCTSIDPDYCDPQTLCSGGRVCDFAKRTCVAGDGGVVVDAVVRDGTASDAAPGVDAFVGDVGAPQPLGAQCGKGEHCQSGFCVDGVCCEKAACGACQQCNAAVNKGYCANIPSGKPAPPGACPGDAICGAGVCDGKGGCAYIAAGQSCGTNQCKDNATAQAASCDGKGACQKRDTACGNYSCNAQTGACFTGCRYGEGCATNSLCTRLRAHLKPVDQGGECLAPGTFAEVKSDLATALAAASPGAILKLSNAAGYDVNVKITKSVTLIGADSAPIPLTSKLVDTPVIEVQDGATLLLENLKISGTRVSNKQAAHGVFCEQKGAGTAAELLVIESVITDNQGAGIYGQGCEVNVLRSSVTSNLGGIVSHDAPSVTLRNTLIAQNGDSSNSYSFGGLQVFAPKATEIAHCTVVNNYGNPFGGIICENVPAGQATIYNSIAQNNDGPAGNPVQVAKCTLSPSSPSSCSFVDATNGDYRLSGGACVGAAVALPNGFTASTIDRDGRPRQNGYADLGAYEK